MDIARLTRQSHRRARAGLRLLDQFDLPGARAHEFCGPARRRLALWLARAVADGGPVIWARMAWHPDRLHMASVAAEIDPARLILVEVARAEDLLWTVEEVLRAGQVSLVVGDLPEPPGLTPVRRLHLAAETGAELGPRLPTGLLLTPGDGGAAGVETRWHLAPDHGAQAPGWRLSRRRARTAPPADWALCQDAQGRPAFAPSPAPTSAPEPA